MIHAPTDLSAALSHFVRTIARDGYRPETAGFRAGARDIHSRYPNIPG